MHHLSIDIETYSSNDIKDGVYKYSSASDFQVLLFAFSLDGGPVQCLDLMKQGLPRELREALADPDVQKHAFNAQFERVCLSRYLGIPYYLDPSQWRCTMVLAQELGLPASLERCAEYLSLAQKKDAAGKNLIKYFSMPCKPTKANGGRTRNLPRHDPEKWQLFIDYCIQDVVVEMAIGDKLSALSISPREWDYYAVDQRINDRGVGLDNDLVQSALYCKDAKMAALASELKKITQLDNPNSRNQLLSWLKERGYQAKGLTKADVQKELEAATGDVKRVLELKLQTSMSSLKKYEAMDGQSVLMGGFTDFYNFTARVGLDVGLVG